MHAACCLQKNLPKYQDVSVDLTNGNGNATEKRTAQLEKMGMGFKFQVGMGIWDGNGNEVTEMGGNWDEKSVPAHLC